MSVLEAHRARVGALNDAMNRLNAMHEEAYALWDRIVALAEGDAPDRREQLDALHDESYALADRIARLRAETFGDVSRETQLLLTNAVESVPLPTNHAEPAPAPVPEPQGA